jgi:hypothetical protein
MVDVESSKARLASLQKLVETRPDGGGAVVLGVLESWQFPELLAEVAQLRELRQAVREWLTDESERPDSAVLFTRVWRLSGLMGERAPDRK